MTIFARNFRTLCVSFAFLTCVAFAARGDEDGGRPATAQISVLALVDRAPLGAARSDVLVRALPAGATLGKVKLKVFDSAGREAGEVHADGRGAAFVDLTEPTVAHGDRVVVTATVLTPGGRSDREGKAVAETRVLYRPHLSLTLVAAPRALTIGQAGTFSSTATEDNGELGAFARLFLSDGGSAIATSDL